MRGVRGESRVLPPAATIECIMERALVVVEAAEDLDVRPTEASKEITRLAGELAAGVGAKVFVMHVTEENRYQDRLDRLASVEELDVQYDVDTAAKGAQQFAANVANEVLADIEVDVTAIGRLGDVESKVLTVADDFDCDHLFITGRQRSPTGKAIFGDLAQSLILNFDGPVTVTTS